MKFLVLFSVLALCAIDVNGFFQNHLKKFKGGGGSTAAVAPPPPPPPPPPPAPVEDTKSGGFDIGSLLA